MKQIINFLIPILVGILIYICPIPEGMDPRGWKLLAIFIATIVGLVCKPLPMGAVALISMAAAVITGTLDLEKEALGGYGSSIIWLVIYVFFIARGFIKTQLGTRIAFFFVKLFGSKSLGLGYSIVLTEFLIAPFIPSSAARAGGIMYPVVQAISKSLGSHPDNRTNRHIGGFLNLISYHGNLITSAMFLTAMAANPMMQSFAAAQGVVINWSNWAIAAIVPGILSLIIIPLVIYLIYPPTIKAFDNAPRIAANELTQMGTMSNSEWIMTAIFGFMLILWIFGEAYGISTSFTALLGLCLLLITKILTWDDILSEKEAWHTLIWFAILVMLAKHLQIFGVINWFSSIVSGYVLGMEWMWAFAALVLIYYYSHYLFASNTSHISSMYAAFFGGRYCSWHSAIVSSIEFGFLF